jgi:hypothetical protein
MEFNVNRGAGQPAAPARPAANGASTHLPAGVPKKSVSWKSSPAWLRGVWVILLFSATALAVAIVALLYFGGGGKQVSYVDSSRQQAVFLTNGQVYFGKISSIGKDFIDLRGIYYLNVNQQVQPDQKGNAASAAAKQSQNSITLVKLGCELHGPSDQMLINRDQVTFWENLKTDGQVAKAIDQWVKQNPNGQKCS